MQLDRGDLRGIGAVDVGDGFELPDGEAAVRALLERSNRYRDLAPEALRARQTQTRIGLLLPDLSHVRARWRDVVRSRQDEVERRYLGLLRRQSSSAW